MCPLSLFRNKRFAINEMLPNLLYIRYKKTYMFFFGFHFGQLYFFLNEFPSLLTMTRVFIGENVKVQKMKRRKKTMWVFLNVRHSKFLSISLEHFIKCKPLIFEECFESNRQISKLL